MLRFPVTRLKFGLHLWDIPIIDITPTLIKVSLTWRRYQTAANVFFWLVYSRRQYHILSYHFYGQIFNIAPLSSDFWYR